MALAAAGTVTTTATGVFQVMGSRTYAEEGTRSPTIFIADASGDKTVITGTATISDPAVFAGGEFFYAATQGVAGTNQTVATFSDPAGPEPLADYSATINWGDGHTSAGTVSGPDAGGSFTVNGANTYAASGDIPITVVIRHDSAPTATAVSDAVVTPAATITGSGTIVATAMSVTGYEFRTPTNMVVATFTYSAGAPPASDFSATIDWGDGVTSAGSVSLSSAGADPTATPQYTVSGPHQYHDEGIYTIHATINQTAAPTTDGAAPATPAASATVSAAATVHEQLLPEGTAGSPNQKYIQEIYRDMFSRQAEPTGRENWVEMLEPGVKRAAVAYMMIKVATSEEFQFNVVNSLYRQYLHRAPEAAGLSYWMTDLFSKGYTIEEVSAGIIGSKEYFQTRGGGTVSGFLQSLYQDVLGRSIESSELTYFSGLMAKGTSTHDIAAMVLSGAEYERVRANELYEQLLGRPAEPAGLAACAAELAQGVTDETIIAQILASDEYFAK